MNFKCQKFQLKAYRLYTILACEHRLLMTSQQRKCLYSCETSGISLALSLFWTFRTDDVRPAQFFDGDFDWLRDIIQHNYKLRNFSVFALPQFFGFFVQNYIAYGWSVWIRILVYGERDVYVSLPTGSGKSVIFHLIFHLIPLVHTWMFHNNPNPTRFKGDFIILIICPLLQ